MERTMKSTVIAWILAISLVLTLIPQPAHAVNSTDESSSAEELDLTEENITDCSETTTTFDLGEGQEMEVFHGGEVRYRDDNGDWTDIDPSLVRIDSDDNLPGYAYRNNAGESMQYFPQSLSESVPLVMEKNGCRIEMSMTDDTLRNLSLDGDTVRREGEEIEDIYGESEEKNVCAAYGNDSDLAELMYTSGENGVKETVTFNEEPESNILEYVIDTGDLALKKNASDEGLTLYSEESEEISASFEAPWMNDDSGNNYSTDISCTLSEDPDTEGRYTVSYEINEEYLSEAEYPVVIDPTVTWKGDDELRDTYVISGSYANTNFYDSGTRVMPVGVNSTGTHRTYIKFFNLKSELSGKSVESASMTLYETGNGAGSQMIRAYRILESWNSTTLTWNNKPSYVSESTAHAVTSGNSKTAKAFDLTTYARKIAGDTSNYGIVLRNTSNSTSYAEFYGSRTTLTAYRPKLVIIYHDKPETASSVSLSRYASGEYVKTSYFKRSASIYATWKGIDSWDLSQVQYKVTAYSGTPSPTSISEDEVDLTQYRSTGSSASDGTNVRLHYLQLLPEGKYRVYIRGKDAAGCCGTAKYKVFYVDGTAPQVTDVSLSPSSSAAEPVCYEDVQVAFKSTDTYLSKTTVKVNDGAEKTASGGKYTIDADLLTEGENTVVIKAYDKAGNISSVTRTVYVDNEGPQIESFSFSVETSADNPSNDTAPVLSWEGASDAVSAELSIDGSIREGITQPSGSLSCSLSGTGEHTACLKVYDAAGNYTEERISYYLDTDTPQFNNISVTPESSNLMRSKNLNPLVSWDIEELCPDRIYIGVIDATDDGIIPSSYTYQDVTGWDEAGDDNTGNTGVSRDLFTQSGRYVIF